MQRYSELGARLLPKSESNPPFSSPGVHHLIQTTWCQALSLLPVRAVKRCSTAKRAQQLLDREGSFLEGFYFPAPLGGHAHGPAGQKPDAVLGILTSCVAVGGPAGLLLV